jgi:hypothetical protein
MSPLEEEIAGRLKAFQSEEDLDALSDASDLIESMDVETAVLPSEKIKFRREKLRLQMSVLNRIDERLDPDFDFDNVPSLTSSPPPELGLPAGVDPSSIKDPQARAKYEKEVAANQQKAARYAYQKRLYKLDRQATERTEEHIGNTYSTSPEDIAELYNLINELVTNERRKTSLKRFALTREGTVD